MNNSEIKRLLKVSKKNVVAVLDHTALIQNGFAIADNFQVRIKIKTSIKGEGIIDLLPLSKMKSIDSAEIRDGFLFVKSGNAVSKFTLVGKIDEFPCESDCKYKIGKLYAADVLSMQNVSQFVGNDELRPHMNGVYFDKDNIVATDAHLLRWLPKKSDINSVIIPGNTTQHFSNSDYTVFADGDKKMYQFIGKDETITIKVIQDNYPNWQNVVPSHNDIKLSIPSKQFISALNSALPSANSFNSPVFLIIKGMQLTVIARDIDMGSNYEETIVLDSNSGKDISIGFNAKLLLSIIDKNITNTEITLSEPNRAGIVNGNTLIMPLMIEYEPECEPTTEPVQPVKPEPVNSFDSEGKAIKQSKKVGKTTEPSRIDNYIPTETDTVDATSDYEPVTEMPNVNAEDIEIITLIEHVTDKSFGIVGLTEIIPDDFLSKYGCKCKLNYKGKRQNGYMLSKKRREQFTQVMQENGLMFTLNIAC